MSNVHQPICTSEEDSIYLFVRRYEREDYKIVRIPSVEAGHLEAHNRFANPDYYIEVNGEKVYPLKRVKKRAQDSEKLKAAWKNCDFCSRSTSDIAEIIRNPERWKELRLGYKCAWKRICQVGFGRFGRLELWRDLCQRRADLNNMPSYNWEPSSWTEKWCEAYRDLIDPPK